MWPQLESGSSTQKLWCGLYERVSEFLTGRLSEHSLCTEVGGETAVGFRDGTKGGLGKVAQGGSVAPG